MFIIAIAWTPEPIKGPLSQPISWWLLQIQLTWICAPLETSLMLSWSTQLPQFGILHTWNNWRRCDMNTMAFMEVTSAWKRSLQILITEWFKRNVSFYPYVFTKRASSTWWLWRGWYFKIWVTFRWLRKWHQFYITVTHSIAFNVSTHVFNRAHFLKIPISAHIIIYNETFQTYLLTISPHLLKHSSSFSIWKLVRLWQSLCRTR